MVDLRNKLNHPWEGGWCCTCIQQGVWTLGLGFHLILCPHRSGKPWQLCPLEQLPAPLERGSPWSDRGRGAGRVTGCYEPGTKEKLHVQQNPTTWAFISHPTWERDLGSEGQTAHLRPAGGGPLTVINEWTSAE